MSKEAIKLALEALESPWNAPYVDGCDLALGKKVKAITALREALAEQPERPYRLLQDNGSKYFGESWDKAEQPAQQALDKMAENARELGIQMQPAQQEPVGCEGAIVNGRVYADRLEHDYKFECEAGPLHLCNDWVEFRRCFEWLAQHTPQPAQQEPVAWICEGSSSDEKHAIDYWPEDVDDLPIGTQLYTTPPAQRTWVELTDDDIDGIYQGAGKNDLKRAREVIAAFKERNT